MNASAIAKRRKSTEQACHWATHGGLVGNLGPGEGGVGVGGRVGDPCTRGGSLTTVLESGWLL